MTAFAAMTDRRSPMPDRTSSQLSRWRVRLAKCDLAARMGSEDADRRRRQVLEEIAATLGQLSDQERAAALPRFARELRLSPVALNAALASRAQQQANPPTAGATQGRHAAAPKAKPSASDLAAVFFALGQRRRKDVERLLGEVLDRVDPTWRK